jgi:zinc protease
MKKLHGYLAVLLMLALAGRPGLPAGAQGKGEPVSVTRATLANGLSVVVVRDTLAPVVSTMLNYEVGADDEPIYGLAHATEHMMFRGSKTLDESQFAEVPAITGGNLNADTQNEVTQYFFTMPSQDLDIALHLEASRAQGLLLDQKAWSLERGAIKQEVVQDNSSAFYRLSVKVLDNMLGGTPYADDGLGSVHSFDNQVNSPQLRAFYDAWYHPNNAVFVIVGDVDPAHAVAKVKELFGGIPTHKLPARRPVLLKPLAPATYHDDSDQPFTLATLNYRFPGYDDPDYAAGQVLADVFNSQRGDLYALVAAGKALGTEFDTQEYPKAGLATAVAEVPVATKPDQALAELRAVIENYRTNGVPASLVEASKLREQSQLAFQGNSIEGLAFQWSQALAVEHRASPQEDVDAIQRVSVDDVNRVLRTYLDDKTATVAYAVPKSAGEAAGEPPRAAENNTVIPKTHEPLPAFARGLLDHLQVPRQTTNPTVTTLANGMTLVVQPESITPTVVLRGHIRASEPMEAPTLPAGIASVTQQLLAFGTTTYDRLAYQAELDKIAADVTAGTDFSLNVLAKDFERGAQLLADDELHPALPQAAFAAVQQRAVGGLEGEQTSPDHIAEVKMSAALYPAGDPARVFATPESAKSITLDSVKKWYAAAYRPDLTTIVVIGDVTPDAARATVEKWFGGWSSSGPKPNVDPPGAPNNRASSVVVPATGHQQDSVRLAETLALTRADADYAPLSVANTILSEGGSAAQLFHDLRDTHGYVYYVGSELGVGRTRSTFEIDFGAYPQNVRKAQALAISDLRHMASTAVAGERLRRAKALLLSGVPLREQSYNGVATQLLTYASNGLPLDQNLIDARRELAVSAAQLRAAFARWIRPDGFARVVVGPEPK